MYAALKDPKGTGIPRSVAEKFVGPKAHEESEMKKPMPAFLMKKDDKKKPAKKMMGGGMAYAKGGGIESKGKTKGKMIKMMGGKAC
jgi:hypothetical protein